jgi:hypothetical protein
MERTKKQYINLDGASKLNHGVSGTWTTDEVPSYNLLRRPLQSPNLYR